MLFLLERVWQESEGPWTDQQTRRLSLTIHAGPLFDRHALSCMTRFP